MTPTWQRVLVFLLWVISPRVSAGSEDESSRFPKRVISLGESIAKSQISLLQESPNRTATAKQYWEKTLQEIKGLTVVKPSDSAADNRQNDLQSQFEIFSGMNATEATTTPRPFQKQRRFEGFPSWDRLLKEWAEDVKDYLGEVEEDSVTGTPTTVEGSSAVTSTTSRLPIPAPARPGEAVLPHTDISNKSMRIWIVTTASLPWMTGTAVNPLLRAAYLTDGRKEAGGAVTLMLPWLERESDRKRVYGTKNSFEKPEDQEKFVRSWLKDTAGMEKASEELQIRWYTAWQNKVENSIYSMGDITALIPAEEVDICVLEEPEHLNWYRAPGLSWTTKFKHVVGIIHTNYFIYAQEQPGAVIRAPAMRILCSWMCRAHCHRIIKLSGTLGQFASEKELIENVHGVRGTFLDIGEQVKPKLKPTDPVFGPEAEPSVYFIGKMLWSKGLGSLMELLLYAEESAGLRLKVDMYGGGPDQEAAQAKANKLDVDLDFHGPIDHSALAFTHKVFVNPSTSEVLCTTVAEALAMGKFVVLPSHPSNDFFSQFPNCLPYATKEEFVGNLYYALTHSPEPLSEKYAHALSWEAATERFEAAGCIPVQEAELLKKACESDEVAIEINLPPLIESEERRKLVASRFRLSRDRYRQYRSKLSQEIQQSTVIPKQLKSLMVRELDKRLDLDIDKILESPKLRLQLSPAELDKSLLQFYNQLAEGTGGDVLRIIGGGQEVALQNFYIKQQTLKQRARDRRRGVEPKPEPFFAAISASDDEEVSEKERTPTQWVKWAMRRNLPKSTPTIQQPAGSKSPSQTNDSLKMCLKSTTCPIRPTPWASSRGPVQPLRSSSFTLLI